MKKTKNKKPIDPNHLKNFKKKLATHLIKNGNWDELIESMISNKSLATSRERVTLPWKKRDGTMKEKSCSVFDVAVVKDLKEKGIYNDENNQTSVAATYLSHFKKLLIEMGIMNENQEIDERYFRELLNSKI